MTQAARERGVPSTRSTPEAVCWRFDGRAGYAALRGQEWLLTNGLGGFAMGSAAGVPTRRYHALLIGATRPPVGRISALNAVAERLETGNEAVDFSTFEFNSRREPLAHPDGASRLVRFECDESARWAYTAAGIDVTRELVLYEGFNAAGLRYTLRRTSAAAGHAARFSIRPLVSLRDFHELIRRGGADDFRVDGAAAGFAAARQGQELRMEVLQGGDARFAEDRQWWYDFFYREDEARGQDCVEDLFSPGVFELPLPSGQDRAEVELVAWMGLKRPAGDVATEVASRRVRAESIAAATIPGGANESQRRVIRVLARSAAAFVVAKEDGAGELAGVSTIAGYPWFSDWGRDTFICLPGLLLATGRHEEARRELESFAAARRNGIIPNVFSDQTGRPEYNTVDASLWFVHAACLWLAETGDRATFEKVFLDACMDVVQSYRRGTDFNIAMDPIDKLITAGTNATQLTWMDARRDGVTFTPRHGKAVEINALWYNALRSLGGAMSAGKGTLAADLNDLATTVGRSFAQRFWDPARGGMFDCLTPADGQGWVPDASVRPNQIFAASLPHCALSAQQRRAVVEQVQARLLTPRGVRTLDPADGRYRGRYRGSLFERDGAYHQGTAWPWLLGAVAEARLRLGEFTPEARRQALEVLQPVLTDLMPGDAVARAGSCAGQIAEVYDGDDTRDEPQRAGGCPAQAWSIAELLRVYKMICSA